MQNCFNLVKSKFSAAYAAAFEGFHVDPIISISNPKFGDYQCNAPMQIYKEYGTKLNFKSPKEIGEKLRPALENDMFSEVNVAPQGFITVKISAKYLKEEALKVLAGNALKKADKTLRIAVDFSSPNVAKEMHVGHLRSTIIGDSICRILERLGHTVFRLNHIGDWGTQFGMLIEYMREVYPDFLKELPPLSALTSLYRGAKVRFDTDADFKKRSQMMVVKLQGGDEFARAAWQSICDLSRQEFNQIYEKLNVTLEERGESYYNDLIFPTIEELKQKDLIKVSEGAQCIFTSIDAVPLMMVKSDGGYGYDSTDVAALRHRLVEMKSDWVIYITDVGQEVHFFKIFDAALLAGWHTPPKTRVAHVGFGVVKGEDGKKFKTRSGEAVMLMDLIVEAAARASTEISKRYNDASDVEINNSTDAGELVGIAAIKYFDLKQNRVTDYKFSFDKMLNSKGNTAVYLLYAYARICSIFRKSGKDVSAIDANVVLQVKEDIEKDLLLTVARFPETIESIFVDFYIHRLAEYVYDLAVIFSEFYRKCRIVGSEYEESRLVLCEVTRMIFVECFNFLGIQSLQRL